MQRAMTTLLALTRRIDHYDRHFLMCGFKYMSKQLSDKLIESIHDGTLFRGVLIFCIAGYVASYMAYRYVGTEPDDIYFDYPLVLFAFGYLTIDLLTPR